MKNAEICSPGAAPYDQPNLGPERFNASVTYTLTARGEIQTNDYYVESKTGRRVYEGGVVEDFEDVNYTPQKALRDYAEILQGQITEAEGFIRVCELRRDTYKNMPADTIVEKAKAGSAEMIRKAQAKLDALKGRLAAIQSWAIEVEDYEVED